MRREIGERGQERENRRERIGEEEKGGGEIENRDRRERRGDIKGARAC